MNKLLTVSLLALATCATPQPDDQLPETPNDMNQNLAKYTLVQLTTDISRLSENERKMIPVLIDAAQAMNRIYWQEAYGDRAALMSSISDDDTRRFVEINYGPWDRLADNQPFVSSFAPKPAGANFYPADLTKEEFEAAAAEDPALASLYTLVRRSEDGTLKAVPYHEAFAGEVEIAAAKLREAAALAESEGLKKYLDLRAQALRDDDYQASDLAWMDMKDNTIEVVIGPIETYEDQLFGFKAAHECFILVKDQEWSGRLARFAELLPALQRNLPVEDRYKAETPGTDSDLNAYDAVYYAGDANAGSKTIAINLPNDEEVQLQKGTRRLQLKNAMRAKFDKILIPLAEELIAADQRQHIKFDSFFQNTMFHEVAHGLGIKQTLTGNGTVRKTLEEQASSFEEGKADVLGLFMVTQLKEMGELPDTELMDSFVTFIASMFRSIRFGASSAHGRANLMRFGFFEEKGAFARNPDGTYRIDFEKMTDAVNQLSREILTIQGDGDYEGAIQFMSEHGQMSSQLQTDLDRLAAKGIPRDIIFEQGLKALGLE